MTQQPDTWRPVGEAAIDLAGLRDAEGLSREARAWAGDLVDEMESHAAHNRLVRDYFEGRVKVKEYGVGASVTCDQSCYWPAKAVDALAERVRLTSLKFEDGQPDEALSRVVRDSGLVNAYNRYVSAKYLNGCMAATVTTNEAGRTLVRLHSAETFTAIPSADFEPGVVAAGLAVARRERTGWSAGEPVPTIVNLHLPGNVVECRQVAPGKWVAEDGPSREREPSLYVLAHKAMGSTAPFGRTRVNRFVRDITDDAIRCLWHMQISGARYSMAKLLFLNLTSRQYDAMMENKEKYQLDSVLLAEQNPDGSTAQVSQLSGNSPQPFIDELMALAKQFAGITSVPLNSLGIVQDNPSSAEAIQAAREDICLVAEQDIEDDKQVLRRVAMAAMAQAGNMTIDELDDHQRGVMADFEQPMLHSMGERADWVTKVNSVRPGFGQTDVAARYVGIAEADLPVVKSEEQRAATAAMAQQIFGGDVLNGTANP